MDYLSLDALEDFDVEDASELADLLDGTTRRKHLSRAEAIALIEAEYNGSYTENS